MRMNAECVRGADGPVGTQKKFIFAPKKIVSAWPPNDVV
jgi:hypothetical protein